MKNDEELDANADALSFRSCIPVAESVDFSIDMFQSFKFDFGAWNDDDGNHRMPIDGVPSFSESFRKMKSKHKMLRPNKRYE